MNETRLVPMHPKHPLCYVTCMGCGVRVDTLDPELLVDLGGEAFKAYYHNLACFRQAKQKEENRG